MKKNLIFLGLVLSGFLGTLGLEDLILLPERFFSSPAKAGFVVAGSLFIAIWIIISNFALDSIRFLSPVLRFILGIMIGSDLYLGLRDAGWDAFLYYTPIWVMWLNRGAILAAIATVLILWAAFETIQLMRK